MLKFAIKRKTLELYHEAVDNKDYLRTKLLIENCDKQYFVVDSLDANGLTPLQRSCFLGNVRLVRLLVDAGANLAIKDREGWTVLHAASVASNYAVVKYLIKLGVDLEAKTDRGELALDLADKDDVVLILVKGMIRKGLYTLVREYFKRNPKTFERIIEDLKKRNKLPKVKLRRNAVRRPRSLDLSKMRKETEKIVTARVQQESNAMQCSQEVEPSEPARGTFRRSFRRTPTPQRKYSIEDLSDDDELDDRRPLSSSSSSIPLSPSWISSSMSSLSSISSNSSSVPSSFADWPDVIYAASHKSTKNSASSRFARDSGDTARRVKFVVPSGSCNVAYGTVAQVNKWIESGKIEVDNLNEITGVAPLHEASFVNNVPVMELLIHKGADINRPSLDGSTPLHAAAQSGSLHAVALLIDCGADLFVENDNGTLPIEETEDEAMISLIQQAMTVM